MGVSCDGRTGAVDESGVGRVGRRASWVLDASGGKRSEGVDASGGGRVGWWARWAGCAASTCSIASFLRRIFYAARVRATLGFFLLHFGAMFEPRIRAVLFSLHYSFQLFVFNRLVQYFRGSQAGKRVAGKETKRDE